MTSTQYIGKCKKCRHATRVAGTDVQVIDVERRVRSATTGELIYLTENLRTYDPAKPYILNGMNVCARCPEHGVYRLQPIKGRLVPDHKCDARCTSATGPKCDCSCGGANHGANHYH